MKTTLEITAALLNDPAFRGMADAVAVELETTPATPARIVGDVLKLDEISLTKRQRVRRSRYSDATGTDNAVAIIGKLPKPGETVHILTNGSYQGVHVIPAVLELAGTHATEALIATLSFSKPNVDTLCALVDARQLRRLSLLASTYFRAGNPENFGYAVEELGKRKVFVSAARSHAKITLLSVGNDRFVITGSANLRSCLAVEQIAITNDPGLFRFYKQAITHIMEQSV